MERLPASCGHRMTGHPFLSAHKEQKAQSLSSGKRIGSLPLPPPTPTSCLHKADVTPQGSGNPGLSPVLPLTWLLLWISVSSETEQSEEIGSDDHSENHSSPPKAYGLTLLGEPWLWRLLSL